LKANNSKMTLKEIGCEGVCFTLKNFGTGLAGQLWIRIRHSSAITGGKFLDKLRLSITQRLYHGSAIA
jgi:hypothetical protein